MRMALDLARAADAAGEVPVGAVVILNGAVIATGFNTPIAAHDPTAHAEIMALRVAAQRLGNYRLQECELFVTLEPCSMCAGAILQARLKRLVFGAADPKTGAVGSAVNLFALAHLNHQTQVEGGVMREACALVLQTFFQRQRQKKHEQRAKSGRALRQDALRTPEKRFDNLQKLPAVPCYVSNLPSLAGLRMHYLDTDPVGASSALVYLHGPRHWCHVWQHEIVQGRHNGHRVICPDLIGFGKSDKPKKVSFHRLEWHAQVLREWLWHLGLINVTLICPEPMGVLSKLVQLGSSQGAVLTRYIQTPPADQETLNAPFPDAGHQSALRAFEVLIPAR